MTREELLKLGLTEAQVVAVSEDYGKNFVPKSQFNAKNEELKALKQEREAIAKEIAALKEANATNEDLKKQIEDLQNNQKAREKEHKESLAQLEVEHAISIALRDAKAKNETCVKALLDLKRVKLENGELLGLKEQLEKVIADSPYLFDSTTPTEEMKGFTPSGAPASHTLGAVTQEQFNKMTYSQQLELFNTNQALYEELSK